MFSDVSIPNECLRTKGGIIFNRSVEKQSGARCARWLSKNRFHGSTSGAFCSVPVEEIVRRNQKRKRSRPVDGESEKDREKGLRTEKTETTGHCLVAPAVRLPAVTSPLFTLTPSTPFAIPSVLFISSLRRPLCNRFALLRRGWSCQRVPPRQIFYFQRPRVPMNFLKYPSKQLDRSITTRKSSYSPNYCQYRIEKKIYKTLNSDFKASGEQGSRPVSSNDASNESWDSAGSSNAGQRSALQRWTQQIESGFAWHKPEERSRCSP